MKRRRSKTQAAPVEAVAPLPVNRSRRGLVARLSERIATKRVLSIVAHPAAAPVVAVVVGAVFVAVALGVVLGIMLAARDSGGGDW